MPKKTARKTKKKTTKKTTQTTTQQNKLLKTQDDWIKLLGFAAIAALVLIFILYYQQSML